jgi:hypothetical protein
LADPSRRGQRISESDLIDESHRALQAAGVGNYLRAAFVHELSNVVVGNPSPLLQHRQPKPVLPKTIAWKSAYEIVLQFLDDHNLALTRATYDVESPNAPRRHTVLTSARRMPTLIADPQRLQMPTPATAAGPPRPKKPESEQKPPERTVNEPPAKPARLEGVGGEIAKKESKPPAKPARLEGVGGEIAKKESKPPRLTPPKSKFDFSDDAMPDDLEFSSDDLGPPE